jgi:nucleotide-binding universal stress UspA family protein
MLTHYHKILIPLDGSPLAEQVLAHLGWLATPAQTELCLVSVIESWRYAAAGPEFPLADLITPVRNELQAYLAAQQAKLQAAGYAVATHVIEGDAAGVILNLVQTDGIDLVAMSSHGRSGFVRWALGSVAERIIHGAQIPVFLVRETTKRREKLQTILLPLDGSATAEQALPEAQTLALANNAQLLLVQVIQKLDEGSQRLLFKDETAAKATFAEWRSQAEGYLAGVAARVTAIGVACDYRVVVDDPDRAICAMSNHADLIVMGTHGRSGLARWVYGSVTNKVLRGASCPLLLIHTLEKA